MPKPYTRDYWHADGSLGELVNLTPWFAHVENELAPDHMPPVFLRLGRDDRGRYVCTGLMVGDLVPREWQPREINAATLRSISIPSLISFALNTSQIPGEYGAAVQSLLDAAPPAMNHPGRAGYQDDHYVSIAAMYRRALVEDPSAPTRWLANTLHQSPPTVRRWLKEARNRGHLGPARAGLPGEGATE